MKITDNEKQIVLSNATFLLKKGFTMAVNDNTIIYSNSKNQIIITFESYSDISIKFIEKNEIFSVGWIACVRKNLKIDPHERLSNILKLLIYIKENYNDLTQLSFCRDSNNLVDDFINKNRK